ncbi:RNA-binding protein [Caulobacter sp. CCUG 60055]|uniref:RNA-binding protein n=1 Tax=Caulobacter sp. CCUG 60055 TaxID=2100090 RepID=UPI001FA7A4D2|nr:RNA-binding protein [Caulobacter sp. CCUG 60055]MBQ1543390.1 RNA-binding protein [Caulobacteraceae bacterium]MCI3179714.1 RNA-binding protein [Caulobacter sp. CCUG 60055]
MTRVPAAPATHAQASRERRDIVTGAVTDEARLVRFVAGPDGVVVPDLGRKLPGRGLWVAADRASVETAARKGLFSRAAKTKLTAPADLADQVEALLLRRVLNALGLARRAGDLTWGFEKASAAVEAGKAAWLVEASDGAADGRRKMLQASRRAPNAPRLLGVFASGELGLALGLDNVIHLVFLAGRGSDRWTADVERLSGFRPLLPESWREEP